MIYKKGNYIRINDTFDRIVSVSECENEIIMCCENRGYHITNYFEKINYIRTSKNIIDLIDKGDYVNGRKVIFVKNNSAFNYVIIDGDRLYEKDILNVCSEEDVKDISFYL